MEHRILLLLFREDGPAGKCLLRKPAAIGRASRPFNQDNITARCPPNFSSLPFTGETQTCPLKGTRLLSPATLWSNPSSSREKRAYSEATAKRMTGRDPKLLPMQSSRKKKGWQSYSIRRTAEMRSSPPYFRSHREVSGNPGKRHQEPHRPVGEAFCKTLPNRAPSIPCLIIHKSSCKRQKHSALLSSNTDPT